MGMGTSRVVSCSGYQLYRCVHFMKILQDVCAICVLLCYASIKTYLKKKAIYTMSFKFKIIILSHLHHFENFKKNTGLTVLKNVSGMKEKTSEELLIKTISQLNTIS